VNKVLSRLGLSTLKEINLTYSLFQGLKEVLF